MNTLYLTDIFVKNKIVQAFVELSGPNFQLIHDK